MRIGADELIARLNSGESVRGIAHSLGVTHQTVCYYRRRCGLPLLRKGRERKPRQSYIDQWGYRMIHAPENGRPNEYVGEHILVAEMQLNKHLTKGEHVHHINGNKLDNRPENLLVLTRAAHRKLHRELETIGYQLIGEGKVVFRDNHYRLAL